MKKIIILSVLALLSSAVFAGEEDMWTMTDDAVFYSSVTKSADFNYRPAYTPVSFEAHDLFQDIKVSAVESVPFAFLYTFAGLWVSKALEGHTYSPKLGTVDDPDNKRIFIITVGGFAAVNVLVNLLSYYDYSNKHTEEKK
jgi:hypothetical protein